MSVGQRESTISTLVLSGSKYERNSWLYLSHHMSWLLISSGEVLVLLLIPLMMPYKCLLTWTSEKQHCSMEFLCPSRWFSLWFLPDLLYLGTYLSSIWSRDVFLNPGLRTCNTKMLLRIIEVLGFVVFFEMSVASWKSDNLVMFQFRVSSSLCLTSFFHNALWFTPDFFLCVYLSHLDLPVTLLSPWRKVRRSSWHSPLTCLHFPQCLSEIEGWGRVRCSQLRAKTPDSDGIWSFPWWAPTLDCCGLCCSAEVCLLWWLDTWDFLVWMADLKVVTMTAYLRTIPLFSILSLFVSLVAFSDMENCSPYLFNELVCLQRCKIPTRAPVSASHNVI